MPVSDEHPRDDSPDVDDDNIVDCNPLTGDVLEPDSVDRALTLQKHFRTSRPHLAEPVMIGEFEAFERIGRGGFGVVYRARDPKLDRIVAVKRCPNPQPDMIERFQREAQILARFSHPNIVAVYELGWHGKDFFYAMELIEGCDGARFIAREPGWRRALEVYIAAATGLAAAHAKGLAHGDFKPANVLIGDDGRVCVADFGLAQSIGKAKRDGEAGPWAGTLPYMAPELFMRHQPNPRTDQFALCVSLWETLYRCHPFEGKTPTALFLAMVAGKVRVPWGAEVPHALRDVLLRGLSADPDDRYPSMEALIEALTQVLSPMPSLVTSATSTASARPWLPFVQGAAVTLVLGSALVLAVLGWLDQPRIDGHDAPKRGEVPPLDPTEPPCALGDENVSSVYLDATVVAVCQFIRDGHFGQAHEAWLDEHEERFNAGKAGLGEQTLIIARTFVEQAEEMQEAKPNEAGSASDFAQFWVEEAAALLGETDVVGDVRNRAEVFEPHGSTISD